MPLKNSVLWMHSAPFSGSRPYHTPFRASAASHFKMQCVRFVSEQVSVGDCVSDCVSEFVGVCMRECEGCAGVFFHVCARVSV